ncbi:hypothetical protein QZM93_38270 [Burkholderia cepacia]|uniref:hypothetical protein n=1 Tax=Burkholderia cepacia TaxID=292 RepID=UPI00264E1AC8|nr:hypothetical protein [Burkholderia cepacia]MDN7894449.1 hypothetical protein [Burkholderia cepacia]
MSWIAWFLFFWAFGTAFISCLFAFFIVRESKDLILGDACALGIVAIVAGSIWPIFIPLWFIAVNKDRVIWRRK